jgi:hypothetical protein
MGNRHRGAVGIVAATLGVLVAWPLAGTATILPQHALAAVVPQLTVPSVTVPSVSTPVATTPSVTTPSVTSPSVSVPSVTTPPVSTPVATAPSVTTPSVSVPSASAPVRTTASKVSARVGGATHSAQASGAPGDPASAAPDSAGAGRVADAVPAAGIAGAGRPSSAASVAGATPRMSPAEQANLARSRGGAHAHRGGSTRRIATARESQRLRRLVWRLHGCLATLGVGARRLLSLRAGLHGPARSAVATARILNISTRREARFERRALKALQRSAAHGCAAPVPVVAPAPGSAATPSSWGPRPSRGTIPTGPAASLSAAHAERAPAVSRAVTIKPATRRAVERAEAGSSFPSLLIPALLALLLGLAVVARPETRRRLRPAGAANPPAGAEADTALQPHPPRLPRTMGPRNTPMDAAMARMAADVFAAMAGDTPAAQPHSQPEGEGPNSQPQVEDEGARRGIGRDVR